MWKRRQALLPRTTEMLIRTACYDCAMPRNVSVRELRNDTAAVVAAVRAGELVTLTVNREPVADIVPHRDSRSPWLPASDLRRIVEHAGADEELLNDLADVRTAFVDG